MKKVLVIGATGLVGKAVAKQLKNDNFEVTILTRNAEKAKSIFAEGINILTGDVLENETLKDVFKGIDFVYINLPEQTATDAMKNIISRAKENRIKQIGYTSGCTVRKENAWHPMIKGHFEAENQIEASGIPFTIFKLTMIMDTIPQYANKGKAFVMGKQPNGWSWIHTADLAKMVSNAFGHENALNKKFTIWGPEKETIPGVVNRFNKVFYRNAKQAKSTPFWMAKIMALFIGKKFSYIISIFKYFENHSEEGDPTEAYQVLGQPLINLDTFLKNHHEKQ